MSEWEYFAFKLYFNSVLFSQFEVWSQRDEYNWLTNDRCSIYTASPTLKRERIAVAERNMDITET